MKENDREEHAQMMMICNAKKRNTGVIRIFPLKRIDGGARLMDVDGDDDDNNSVQSEVID